MGKWIFIFLFFLLHQFSFVRAQNFILLDDATGVNITESEINPIESLIGDFLAELPDSGQLDFKVIVGGLYLPQYYYEGGYSSEIANLISSANNEYPYHLLIIKYIHNQSGDINWNVFISLPDTGIYLCKELADIGIISETIKQSLLKGNGFVQSIDEALNGLNEYIVKLNICCSEGGRESCELHCLSEEFEFSEYLNDLGLKKSEYTLETGSYQSTTNVIVNSQLKIENAESLINDLYD